MCNARCAVTICWELLRYQGRFSGADVMTATLERRQHPSLVFSKQLPINSIHHTPDKASNRLFCRCCSTINVCIQTKLITQPHRQRFCHTEGKEHGATTASAHELSVPLPPGVGGYVATAYVTRGPVTTQHLCECVHQHPSTE